MTDRPAPSAQPLPALAGGNITILTALCEQTRGHAFDRMLAHVVEREERK